MGQCPSRVDYRREGVSHMRHTDTTRSPAQAAALLRRLALPAVVAVAVVGLALSVPRAEVARAALPRSAPELQGVSSTALLDFVQAADRDIDAMHSLMVLRHGHVIAEGWWAPYAPDVRHTMYSLTKSFTSTAIGLAVSEGLLSIDDPVLKFFPDEAPAEPSDFLKALRVRDLLSMATGHHKEPALAGEGVPTRPRRSGRRRSSRHRPTTSQGRSSSTTRRQATCCRPSCRRSRARRRRLPAPAAVRPARDRRPGVGDEPRRRDHRRLRAAPADGVGGALRPALPAEGHVAGPAGRARGVGGGGDEPAGVQRQQPGQRLGPGLRIPVLAYAPRRVPRRRRVRPVLPGAAGTGRGRGHHERREEHAGRARPRVRETASGVQGRTAAGGPGRRAPR